MRLIDADALLEQLGMANECEHCPSRSHNPYFCRLSSEMMLVCELITEAPTVVKEQKIYEPALAELLKTGKGAEIIEKAKEFSTLIREAIAERLQEDENGEP